MNGAAMDIIFKEIDLFEVRGIVGPTSATRERYLVRGCCGMGRGRRGRANLVGEADFDDMPFSTALQQAEDSVGDKATNGLPDNGVGKTGAAGEPCDGEMETALPLQMAVTKKMNVDSAIRRGELELRYERVGELFPDARGVCFLGFHF